MKSTGITRKIDELGRLVIPKELRRTLDIEEGTPMEIFVDGEQIILQKYTPNMTCVATGEVSNTNHVLLGGKLILSTAGVEKLLSEIQK